jgi:hypothetical protein
MRGGYGTSDHGTLADRNPSHTAEPAPPAIRSTSPARHCHVDGQPSLLVEWRRGATGWEGRVISQVWLDGAGWATVERWLSAGQIQG